METPKSGTPCKVPIHYIETGDVAYTIHAVVSSLTPTLADHVSIALREIHYPDGTVAKVSGVSCYHKSRVRITTHES